MCEYYTVYVLDWIIGFIDGFTTSLVITSNYSLPLFYSLYSSLLHTHTHTHSVLSPH
jgi:hypothetical protein